VLVAAYAHQLETLLTEKIDALTKFRGQFFALFYKLYCCLVILLVLCIVRAWN